MKKIFLILTVSVLLIGCDADVNTVEAEKKNSLIITKDATYFGGSIRTFIITDTETDQEYIGVKYAAEGGGVAITPRLKPETVLKERE